MGLPVELGDMPGWIGAGTGIVNVLRGLSARQQAQAWNWGEMLDELTDLEPEELRPVVKDNPVIAEIVGLAAEEAARTASDHKRYLLAQVAAAALQGATTPPQIEALKYLARTVIALDSPDLTLLVVIGTAESGEPRPTDGRASWAYRQEILNRWPSPPDLVAPAISALERAGVIEMRDFEMGGAEMYWALSPYGRRFLNYLLTDLGGWPPRRQLEGG